LQKVPTSPAASPGDPVIGGGAVVGGFTDGGAVGVGLAGGGAVVVVDVDVDVDVDGASDACWMLSAVLFAGLAVKSGRPLLHDTTPHPSTPMSPTHVVLRMPIASATSLPT
jgi:hypothetical protein